MAALVLAGGAARRFGADKTRAPLGDDAVLGHVVAAVGRVTADVVVIGPWAPDGVPARDEPPPRRGPAAALAFGLAQAGAPWVLVVGGDHPLVRPELLDLLVGRAVAGGADVVVPVRDGRDEPLVACYRRAVGPVISGLVSRGDLRLRSLFDCVPVDRVDESIWRSVDPDGRSFMDVDTVEDLERVGRLLER